MTKTKTAALAAALTLASMGAGADDKQPAAAPAMTAEQQAMMEAYARAGEIRTEQKQLKYFEGTWSSATKMWMDPKAPPQESTGTAKMSSLYDGRYLVFTQESEYGGQKFQGQGLMGFDNLKGKFFSTWVDSMSTGFWLSYGTYDAAKKVYTFHGEMPDIAKPTTSVKVRQLFRIIDDNHYAFDWYETRGGKENRSMEITYTRK